ncbi:MAG: DUF4258 domain-containing protein [Candidatus Binatia bacterium]
MAKRGGGVGGGSERRGGKGERFGDRPLSYKRAMERIRMLWKEGTVIYSLHALKRLRERKIDVSDVVQLIRYGHVVSHHKPDQFWRYTVAGLSVDRERLSCSVEINGKLIIVTVMD